MSPRRPSALAKERIGYDQVTIRVPHRLKEDIDRADYKKLGFWSRAEWLRSVLEKAVTGGTKRD
jgi:hypothetical protein